ncbi:Aminopeptidase, partial [Gryllus bimaculatus]
MKRLALAAVLVILVMEEVSAEAYLNPTDIRLPRKVWPHFYNLYITTSVCEDNPDFSFYGQVDINVEVKIATSTIKINAKHLNISFAETTLKSLDRNELIPVSSQDIDEEHEFLIIHFPLTLCTNCVYVLHIEFKGILRTDLKGYYRSEYIDTSSGVRKWSAVTQFQATDARRAFPCFDEPEYKATFKIHLGRPRSCTALSNMPLIITQNIEGLPDWVMDEFDVTKRMSTYLVAWAVTDFQCVNSLTDGRIRVCSRPDGLIYSNLALSVGPASLRYYEKYFDVAYPLPKSDMIAVPDFDIGAMENWGLITY